MQWYYSKNGTQLGPVELDEMISKVTSGEISPTDLVWREGMADWTQAGHVSELNVTPKPAAPLPSAFPTSLEPSSPYAPPAAPAAVPAAVPAAPYYPVGPPVSSGKGTASMVLGIVACVVALCGCYGMAIALPCGIIAIILGGQMKKESLMNPMLAPEFSKAKAGVTMGWIGIIVSIVATIISAVFVWSRGSGYHY